VLIADILANLGQFVLEKNEEATEQAGPVHAGWGIECVGWAKAHRAEQGCGHEPSCAFAHAVRPRRLTAVSKVARGQRAMPSAAAGDFAHPTHAAIPSNWPR